jgi:hypothetical protein
MPKRFLGFALLCAAVTLVLFHPLVAFAATTITTSQPTTVTVGWGDYVVQAAQTLALLAFAALMALARNLPAQIYNVLVTARAEQLLGKAIGWGLNAVDGAVQGKTLTVDVGRSVTAQAVQYVVSHGSGWLVTWLGGPVGVAQKIWARLPLEDGATKTDFNHLAVEIAASNTAQ